MSGFNFNSTGTSTGFTGFAGFGNFGGKVPAPAPAPAQGLGFGGFGLGIAPTANAFAGNLQVPTASADRWEGSQRIRGIQLSYAPYVDAAGNPVVLQPNNLQQLQQVTDNEEKCEFDVIVYDRKIPGGNKLAKHKISQPRLEEALRNNPDPEGSVPIRLLGIQELRNRFAEQCKESQALSKNANAVHDLIKSLDTSLQAQTLKFQGLRSKQTQLYNKMLSIMRKVEVLRCYGCRLSRDEHSLRERLETLSSTIQPPRDRILRLVNIQAQREQSQQEYNLNVEEDDLEAICLALDKQRQGLQILSDVLTKDSRDIQIIKQKLKL